MNADILPFPPLFSAFLKYGCAAILLFWCGYFLREAWRYFNDLARLRDDYRTMLRRHRVVIFKGDRK